MGSKISKKNGQISDSTHFFQFFFQFYFRILINLGATLRYSRHFCIKVLNQSEAAYSEYAIPDGLWIGFRLRTFLFAKINVDFGDFQHCGRFLGV